MLWLFATDECTKRTKLYEEEADTGCLLRSFAELTPLNKWVDFFFKNMNKNR